MYAFNLLLAFVCFVCFIGPHIAAWINLYYACTNEEDYATSKAVNILLALILIVGSAGIAYAMEVAFTFYTSFVFPAMLSIF